MVPEMFRPSEESLRCTSSPRHALEAWQPGRDHPGRAVNSPGAPGAAQHEVTRTATLTATDPVWANHGILALAAFGLQHIMSQVMQAVVV